MKLGVLSLKKRVLKVFLYIVFIGSILGATGYHFYYYGNEGESEDLYEEMEQVVEQQKEVLHEAAKEQIQEQEVAEKRKKETNEEEKPYLDIKDMKNINEDIYAWIEIPDTEITYPVLASPKEDYYLMHNVNHSYGYPGCIYSNPENGVDLASELTVLYGHNMKNGSMFGTLNNFLQESYFEEHPYIYIYTEDKVNVYEIVAAVEWKDKNLLKEYNAKGSEGMDWFCNAFLSGKEGNCRKAEFCEESKFLTLSTCVRGQKEKRMLVIGVLK